LAQAVRFSLRSYGDSALHSEEVSHRPRGLSMSRLSPSEPNRPTAQAKHDTHPPAHRVRESRSREPDDSRRFLEQFVYEHGQLYDSYLATEPGREAFWSTGNRGLIAFTRHKRHVLVSGGLIAPADEKERLLEEFLNHTERLRLRPVFFGIPGEDLPLFRRAGYRVTKLGEDALVDLGDLTFGGKKFEWVRRQANYCRRQGVVVSEARSEEATDADWRGLLNEIAEISNESLADKPQSEELRFFDGRIGEHELGLRRLFIARSDDGNGRIEGYVVCNPIDNGRRWSTEIYRHRPDSVRGVIPFLLHSLILQLQDEGVEQVNLCIVPAQNCETPLAGDNPLVRRGLQVAVKYFGLVFDLAGIGHFKSRFRPRYEDRYLCAPQQPSLGAFIATLKVFGVFRLDYPKTARLLWGRLRKRASRKSLSTNKP
jgi:phosphatidylglycerol lysyltransferase